MGLMDGKKLLITGVLTDASLAFEVARLAQIEGAEVVLTGAGRAMRLTERTARKLPEPCDVLALDVTKPQEIEAVFLDLQERWGHVDGVLHAIGFAPEACLGGNFLNADWEDVSVALHISAYSLKALAGGLQPLLVEAKGSIVGLTFDASVAWPVYDWMGVAKAAFESTARYLAKSLGPQGIRVNLISAGPIRTMAASIRGERSARLCTPPIMRSRETTARPAPATAIRLPSVRLRSYTSVSRTPLRPPASATPGSGESGPLSSTR